MSHSETHALKQMQNEHHHDESHGSVKSYLIGFVLSVILTAIPFYMVMSGDFSKATTLYSIITLAVVQIWVHLKYFLHLNFITEDDMHVMKRIESHYSITIKEFLINNK